VFAAFSVDGFVLALIRLERRALILVANAFPLWTLILRHRFDFEKRRASWLWSERGATLALNLNRVLFGIHVSFDDSALTDLEIFDDCLVIALE